MEFYHRIHCKYASVKGFVKLYNDALRYRYMITEKALQRARIMAFYEKYGVEATLDAFKLKRRTFFLWKKKLKEGNGRLESLNNKSRAPKRKRKRIWNEEIIKEIKKLRFEHPNLGKEKIHPLLTNFCKEKGLASPKISTIGRLIKDLGGLRMFPQKVSHFGKIKPIKRRKRIIKPTLTPLLRQKSFLICVLKRFLSQLILCLRTTGLSSQNIFPKN